MGMPLKRTLSRLFRLCIFVATAAMLLQSYLRGKYERDLFNIPQAPLRSLESKNKHADKAKDGQDITTFVNSTLWAAIANDPSLSAFYKLNEALPSVKMLLNAPSQVSTVFAPINSAFDNQVYPADAPDFYYIFLSINHISRTSVSYSDLTRQTVTTVPNMIVHNIWYRYLQRLSIKDRDGAILFNHRGRHVGKSVETLNGYIHHIDTLLHLPDAASDALRDTAAFGTFRKGLIFTDVAVQVNDTQGLSSQTIFVPSNQAFEKLGRKLNRFLFSAWGKPYLAALLRYHIVANQTLFTDTYFKPDGLGQAVLDAAASAEPIMLPTLLSGQNLTTCVIRQGHRQTIQLNGDTVVSEPDIIVMDGVLHQIETVLLPPLGRLPPLLSGTDDSAVEEPEEEPLRSWTGYLPWTVAPLPHTMGVEELMERLQPYVG